MTITQVHTQYSGSSSISRKMVMLGIIVAMANMYSTMLQ
jgi:hypothetical protein